MPEDLSLVPRTHIIKKPVMSLPVKVDLGGWLASQTSVLKRSRPAGDNV